MILLYGPLPWLPHPLPQIGEPYTREDVLEYLAYCQQQIVETVRKLNLAAVQQAGAADLFDSPHTAARRRADGTAG